jgi:hypothetical protein
MTDGGHFRVDGREGECEGLSDLHTGKLWFGSFFGGLSATGVEGVSVHCIVAPLGDEG